MSARYVCTCCRCSAVSFSRHFRAAASSRPSATASTSGRSGSVRSVRMVTYSLCRFFRLSSSMPTSVITRCGIDLLGLGVGQLVADDQADRLGGDAQPAGDFLLVAADQQPQHLLLEAVGVAGVLALEGRDQVLAVVAPGAAVEGGLVDPEAGLAPEVQVADHLDACP